MGARSNNSLSPESRRRGIYRIAAVMGLVTVALIAVAGAVLVLVVRGAHPSHVGETRIPGLNATVTVTRDELGIPRVEAESLQDLFRAQGYVHAQERLWQMEFQRRVVQGRLSELFGPDLVESDMFLRRIGLREVAERVIATASPEALEMIDAYVSGVNEFIEHGPRPLELRLFRVHPEKWERADVGAVPALMGFDLGLNWRTETVRQAILDALGAEYLAPILPPYEYSGPPTWTVEQARHMGQTSAPAGATGEHMEPIDQAGATGENEDLPRQAAGGEADTFSSTASGWDRDSRRARRLSEILDAGNLSSLVGVPRLGSNSWVVSGDRTADGVPLLANDPHLGLALPSLWYELELLVPGEIAVRGFSIPGAPAVAIGFNRDVAWGLTNTADTQDLYFEHSHPDDPYRFLQDRQWYDAEVRTEEISVSGRDETVPVEIVRTRTGPLIARDPDLSLAWSAYHIEKSTFDAFLGMNRAESWQEFRRALRAFSLPAQNLVYGDRHGTIAFRTVGAVPDRRSLATTGALIGDGADEFPIATAGVLPGDGRESENGWTGMIPFEELPELVNPPQGFIATANHLVADKQFPHRILNDPAPPSRMQRIVDQLRINDTMTVEDSIALQTDWYNRHARDRAPRFLEALFADRNREIVDSLGSTGERALELVQAWSCNPWNVPDSAGASIFGVWYHETLRGVFEPTLGEEIYQDFIDEAYQAYNALEAVLTLRRTAWTPEGIEEPIATAFLRTVETLTDRLGPDPEQWRWDRLQTLEIRHVLGEVPVIGGLLNRGPYPYGGDHMTVGRSAYDLAAPFEVQYAAGVRMVVRLEKNPAAWVAHAGGQSGHPFHRQYADQLQDWIAGVFRTIPAVGSPADGAALGDGARGDGAVMRFRPR